MFEKAFVSINIETLDFNYSILSSIIKVFAPVIHSLPEPKHSTNK